MTNENIRKLSEYRLEQAEESLKAAEVLISACLIRPTINRIYYAMFYAVSALLAINKKETSKHSGVISLFDKEYVKAGIFPKKFSRWLHDAFDLRQRSDYSVQYTPTIEEAGELLAHATCFVSTIIEELRKTND